MDKIIREGELRRLITESSCDVILSCKNHRLMAHKLMLSIVSPIFRILLLQNPDSPVIIIMPDTPSAIMSLILDYIYTGTVLIPYNLLSEFLSTIRLLQIAIDYTAVNNILESYNNNNKKEILVKLKNDDYNGALDFCKKSTTATSSCIQNTEYIPPIAELIQKAFENTKPLRRKMPDLLPIIQKENMDKKNIINRKICTKVVVPSPWCPRNEKIFFGDPRETLENEIHSNNNVQFSSPKEDSNNNFQISRHDNNNMNKLRYPNYNNSNNNSNKLDNIIRNLYLNNPEKKRNKKFKTRLKQEHEKHENEDEEDNEVQQSIIINNNNNLNILYRSDKVVNQSLNFDVDSSDSCSQTDIIETSLKTSTNNPQMSSLKQTEINLSCRKQESSLTSQSSSSTSSSSSTITCINLPQLNNQQKSDDEPINSLSSSSTTLSNNENENSLESVDSFTPQICDGVVKEEKDKEDESNRKTIKKKSYECIDCGKRFSQMRNYKYHRSVHEGTKEFSAKCPECDKTFNDKGYLSSHMKIHRDKKEYACPNCPKRFNQRVAYNMHLRIHTGLKPHECSTCGKSFSRKMLLKQHQRVHTGERPYSCPECGKTFADRSNMSLHARLHTGVKPYTCTLCPKSFTKKHHLKTHMNFHTGLKPYTCENCGLSFSQSSNMRTHYKKCILKDGSNVKKDLQNEAVNSTDNSS